MTVTIAASTERAAASPISSISSIKAAAATNSSHMTQQSASNLSIGAPLESEYEALAEIIRASFAISGKSVWLDCSIEECIQFRIAAMKHRNSLRILYDQGKISTPNRMMVARNASTGQVVGVAIWTLEDDLSDEAVQKREEEEARLSFPSAEIPSGANKDLWDRSMQAAEKAHDDHLGRRARCCECAMRYRCRFAFDRSGKLANFSPYPFSPMKTSNTSA